jgi:DNA-directed RNA polymerase specialized sigma24 family protein
MIRKASWAGNKNATWASNPTGEQTVEQFASYIAKIAAKYTADFRLSDEDAEDLKQELFLKLLSLPPSKVRKVFYVLRSLRNAAASFMAGQFGVPRKNGKPRISKTQQTTSLDVIFNSPSTGRETRDLRRATEAITDKEDACGYLVDAISLSHVLESLSSNARIIFDFVLVCDKPTIRVVNELGKSLGLSKAEVASARLEIVSALHAAGFALAYPPPKLEFIRKERPIDRLLWLINLARKFDTAEHAAHAAGLTRNSLNYHSRILLGVSFPEFARTISKEAKNA